MPQSAQKEDGKVTRPPVVGIFGHIDHGKSSLIDYIRETNITEKEAGGITQHVGAYEVSRVRKDGRMTKLTLLDTPRHASFDNVRNRGTRVADIAVLIVSAEDGVKPQTLESFKYIKENALPMMVAITKTDKPAADILRAKQTLAENSIFVEGYGGDTPVVALSAKTGEGVEEFLDMIELMAQMEHLEGEPEAFGSGIVIESSLDAKRGIAAVGIIKNGTVRRGTFAASGDAFVPIRFILDAAGNTVEELSLSSPVKLIGWDKLPPIGREFVTFLKKEDALAYIEKQKSRAADKEEQPKTAEGVTLLPIILKADTAGSLEAVEGELKKITRERIAPKVIVSGVGSVNENDVKTAIATTGAVIVGFNVKIDAPALSLSERSGVKILSFGVIYELTDKVIELVAEREPKVEIEEITGSAKVLKIFSGGKGKQVLGARVITGSFSRGAMVKLIRREAEIGRGTLKELQQAKAAVNTVNEGTEFGAMVEAKTEAAPGDILEAVILVTK